MTPLIKDDFFAEGEPPPDEPAAWRPAVTCPQCGETRTRMVTLRHEMSVYTCELCHIEFEIEEDQP